MSPARGLKTRGVSIEKIMEGELIEFFYNKRIPENSYRILESHWNFNCIPWNFPRIPK
jgi:hypothetical protein